jgi:putative effector of murein hydrolase
MQTIGSKKQSIVLWAFWCLLLTILTYYIFTESPEEANHWPHVISLVLIWILLVLVGIPKFRKVIKGMRNAPNPKYK